MAIVFRHKGDLKKTEKYLKKLNEGKYFDCLNKYGAIGVDALAEATPKDSGLTASSWIYTIERTDSGIGIYWENTNENDGVNIAIILQYGHGTGTGGYVKGRDYINPALRPIFDEMAENVWKEVTSD